MSCWLQQMTALFYNLQFKFMLYQNNVEHNIYAWESILTHKRAANKYILNNEIEMQYEYHKTSSNKRQ